MSARPAAAHSESRAHATVARGCLDGCPSGASRVRRQTPERLMSAILLKASDLDAARRMNRLEGLMSRCMM
jgi:hypothetical protein